jgi:hypothetical protein
MSVLVRIACRFACLGTLCVPFLADAQTCGADSPGQCTTNTIATLTVPAVIQVLVSPAAPSTPASIADFEAGYGTLDGSLLTVSANTSWALSISAATPTWLATSTLPGIAARPDKPAEDLHWSVVDATFTPLDMTTRQLASGPATNAFVRTLNYRVLYSLLLDSPGRYEMTVLLTITAP